MTISIHALRKESDSTPSDCQPNPFISIHALRKESDTLPVWARIGISYFNPRSP